MEIIKLELVILLTSVSYRAKKVSHTSRTHLEHINVVRKEFKLRGAKLSKQDDVSIP